MIGGSTKLMGKAWLACAMTLAIGGATGCGAESDGRPVPEDGREGEIPDFGHTMFVPRVLDDAGLDGMPLVITGLQLSNDTAYPADVEVHFQGLTEDDHADVLTATVDAHGSRTLILRTGRDDDGVAFHGSAVVTSTQPLRGMVNLAGFEPGEARAASSKAIDMAEVSTLVHAPLVMCRNAGFRTVLHVQNTEPDPAEVQVTYRSSETGVASNEEVLSIPGYGVRVIDQGWACDPSNPAPLVEAGFVGSAAIKSLTGQGLAVQVLEISDAATLAYNGFPDGAGAKTLYAPLVMSDNAKFSTGLQVVNTGDETTLVSVDYAEDTEYSGYQPDAAPRDDEQDAYTLAPGESITLVQTMNSDPTRWGVDEFGKTIHYVGSAVVRSSASPVVAIVNQVEPDTGTASVYEAVAADDATSELSFPLVMHQRAFFTGLSVQSVGPVGTGIELTYTPYETESGVFAPEPVQTYLEPGETFIQLQTDGLWQDLAENGILEGGVRTYVGSVTVRATAENAKLTGIVNVLGTENGPDRLGTYVGFPVSPAVTSTPELSPPSCASNDCTAAPDCVFSVDCPDAEVCWDNGACAPALAGTCDADPNPWQVPAGAVVTPLGLRSGGIDPAAGDVATLLAQLDHVDYVADDTDGRLSLFEELTHGMSDVRIEGNTMVFDNTMLSGPIREALKEAAVDNEELRDTAASPAQGAPYALVAAMAEMHEHKLQIRPILKALQDNLRPPSQLDLLPQNSCAELFDRLLREDGELWYRSLSSLTTSESTKFAALNCLGRANAVLHNIDGLDKISEAGAGATLVPLHGLQAAVELTSLYTERVLQAEGPPTAFDEILAADCNSLARARELMLAVELHGTFARDSMSAMSNLFPLTDMEVDIGGTTSFGDRAVAIVEAVRGGTDAETVRLQSVEALNAAASVQFENLAEVYDLAQDFEHGAEVITDLAPILLGLTDLLIEHPEYQRVYDGILAELDADDQRRMWAGISLGLGCAGGTAVAAFTQPVSWLFVGGALAVCGADLALEIHFRNGAGALARQLQTLRFSGATTSLAAHGALQDARTALGWANFAVTVAFLGTVADGVELTTPVVRRTLQAASRRRAIRGYGYAALARENPTLLTPVRTQAVTRELAERFPDRYPSGLGTQDEFVQAIMDGQFWRYHNEKHTGHVVEWSKALAETLLDRGLIDAGDVELAEIAAAFHDTEQIIDSVNLERWSGGSQVTRRKAVGEIDSAHRAVQFMRETNERLRRSGHEIRFSQSDMDRVQRAIVEGTTIAFDFVGNHTLIPQGLIADPGHDPGAFFRRIGSDQQCVDIESCDWLPFILAVADFWQLGAGSRTDTLEWWARFIEEEYPAVLRNYVYAENPDGAMATTVRGFLLDQAEFQPRLVEGRRWVAQDSYGEYGVGPDVVSRVRDAVSDVYGRFVTNRDAANTLKGEWDQLRGTEADQADAMLGTLGIPLEPGLDR